MRTKAEVDRQTWIVGLVSGNSVGLVVYELFTREVEIADHFRYHEPIRNDIDLICGILVIISLFVLPGLVSWISWERRIRWGLIPVISIMVWHYAMVMETRLGDLLGYLLFYPIAWPISFGLVSLIGRRLEAWHKITFPTQYLSEDIGTAPPQSDPHVWPPPPSH